MGERVVPFEPNEKCDVCGSLGAFDFYGDFLCEYCAQRAIAEEKPSKRRKKKHGKRRNGNGEEDSW